jgi:VIT1/CCC1 family predicted Fe2+/Mn2+ transporter
LILNKEIIDKVLTAQRNEITEHVIYSKLAQSVADPQNKSILKRISEDERKHYDLWKEYSHQEVKPSRLREWEYYFLSKMFGITFGMKLMEKGEAKAQAIYKQISEFVPAALDIEKDESDHERELLNSIDEERLRYVGSMVLGLNDALVELTGALAGFTLALQNRGLIATAGLITGIAASLSMAASEYLSTKSEGDSRDPLKASIYTGSVYIFTMLFLIFPYFLFENHYFCLGLTFLNALLAILIFSFYVSVAKDIPFRKRFFEMAIVSMGIAALSFAIGFLVRRFLSIDIR